MALDECEFLSVIHTHTQACIFHPFAPPPLSPLQENIAKKIAVLLPGIERSDLAEGTKEINLGFSHTETKTAQEKGFMPHYRGGP